MPTRPAPIPLSGASLAMPSGLKETSRAIIFVHGYGGSVSHTWHRFQEMLQSQNVEVNFNWWNRSDLYFYSYESRRFSIDEHVGMFSRFLDETFPNPKALLAVCNGNLPVTSKYRELFLIGHSLGAVVVRKAILDRGKKSARFHRRLTRTADPLMHAKLRLFAPAMLGVRPTSWLGLFSYLLQDVSGFGNWFKAALESQSIIQQLNPESREIQQLQKGTDELAEGNDFAALAAHVVFGEHEHLVARGKYTYDEIGEPIPAKDHRSICKPTDEYLSPFGFIEKGVELVAKRHRAS